MKLRPLYALVLLAALLAGCQIEGGRPEVGQPAPAVQAQPTATSGVSAAIARRNDVWEIAVQDLPRDLYPYQLTMAQARIAAPLTELFAPAPVLVHNFGYTTTGVLQRIPSLANGDVVKRQANVFLDAAGQITTTATSVITQVAQLEVTYHWNPALRWSDGTALTADDSVFAYELARQDAPNDEARERVAQTASYTEVDDHTTRALLQPDLTGPGFVSQVWTPLPRHVLRDTPASQVRASQFARQPLSYGPYKLVSKTDTVVEFERNDQYYGPPPQASRVRFTLLRDPQELRGGVLNGTYDVGFTDRAEPALYRQLAQDEKAKTVVVSYPLTPIWEHIDFNLDVPVLQDLRVRRAIALGMNRTEISKRVFGGHAPLMWTWIIPSEPEAAKPGQLALYGYSPKTSNKLLDEAGYNERLPSGFRATPQGITLTLTLLTTTGSPIRRAIVETFRDDMRAIGIDINVLDIPPEQLFDQSGPLYQRQFELTLFGWSAGPEPGGLGLWSCSAVPSEQNSYRGQNFAGWCFREADRAIRRGVTALDDTERIAAYLTQQQLWTQELPSMALVQRPSVVLIANGISSVRPDSSAPITWNVAAWHRPQ